MATSRLKRKGIDKTLLGIIILLCITGLVTLASASSSLSQQRFNHSPYYFLYRQMIFGIGIGGILFFLAFHIPLSFYHAWAPALLIASIFLVLLVFVPGIGLKIGGATRWIHVGSFSFQPSEFLKLTFVMYLASWLASKRKEVTSYTEGFLPFLVITGFVSLFMVLEPDIGTLGVLALSALLLFFVGGGKRFQITISILLGMAILVLIIYLEPYRQSRLFVFFNPEAERQGAGYHVNQALIAIGSGGMFGKGWGLSRQKFQYLPEPAGDAIFAVYAEELGFIGTLFLIALFAVFFIRGMLIAERAKDIFAQLFAAGIIILVIVQVIVNIGAISAILPLTGIPLPFVSYGGTALAFLLFEMGILLNISRNK